MTVAARKIEGGHEVAVSINPGTLEEIATIPMMRAEEVRAVVRVADQAFVSWKNVDLRTRIKHLQAVKQYILDHVDEITATISREMGKPRVEALVADVMPVVDLITFFCKEAPKILADRPIPMHLMKFVKESKIVYEPLGVVSVIAPWNFPFAIPMSGIVFALLGGNTVVFKPASDVPTIGQKIEECINKGGGFPKGVFNLVIASGAATGSALYEPPIKKVVFTGSTEVGKRIMSEAGKHLIPVVLELGGKDPMVVFEDADIERAAQGAVWGAFTNAGQVCASIERCYVHESIYDRFVEKVAEKTKALRVGADTDGHVDMGPVVNEGQVRIVTDHIDDAVKHGAKVMAGGHALKDKKGYFVEPTVLVDVTHEMRCIREETFGPTLPIMKFKDEEEAIRLANDSIYGLTASVWTKNLKRGERVARKIEAGSVLINDHAMSYGLVETPWQGVKESGIGRSHSAEGLLEFVFPKHICVDHSPRALKRAPYWYPYSPKAYTAFKGAIRALFGGRGRTRVALEMLRNLRG